MLALLFSWAILAPWAALSTVPSTAPPAGPAAVGDGLQAGDPVPPLTDVTWIRGEPVSAFEPGTVYVVDMFGIWCSSCRGRIELLSTLADEYAASAEDTESAETKVVVIAVAIAPDRTGVTIDEFVDKHDDKIHFLVAEDRDDKTTKTYLDSAGREVQHDALIIDGEGRLAWTGLAGAIKDVLPQILDGSFDARGFAKARRARIAAWNKAYPETLKFNNASSRGDHDLAARLAKDIARSHESLEYYFVDEYTAYLRGDQGSKAKALGRRLMRRTLKDNRYALRSLAWKIVDPKARFDDELRDYDLAEQAATRAGELFEDEDPWILLTQAWLAIHRDENPQAQELLKQARPLAEDDKVVSKLIKRAERAASQED